MAKSLVLTTAEQSLAVSTISDLSIVKVVYADTTENENIIERNESTNDRQLVPTSNLLNLNGFIFATLSNSVVEI
jgi:hypothetical protein